MLIGFILRICVKDGLLKSLPALSYLVINLFILQDLLHDFMKTIAVAEQQVSLENGLLKIIKPILILLDLVEIQLVRAISDIEWRQVDLYSISSTTKALKNVDIEFIWFIPCNLQQE